MATLRVHVIPNAKIDKLTGEHGDAIKVKLRAPAVEGKANAALITLLARKLNVTRRQVLLQSGEKSRDKLVRVEGLDSQTISERLLGDA
jgi:uncharacterized protein (TIGR00251 family)